MIHIRESMTDALRPSGDRKGDDEAAFAKAIDTVLATGKSDYPSYIGGLKVASGMSANIYSPIDNTIIFGTYQESEEGLADRAVTVAKDAYKSWSGVSAEEKVSVFEKILSRIEQQRYRLAAMVSVSVGMDMTRSLNEVDTLISVIGKACEDIKTESGSPQGVWAILSAFNSPLASPMGYAAVAIIAGNTVAMVPSVHSTLPVFTVYRIFEDCGIPDGVLNIITDSTNKMSSELANNLDITGIVATGSGERLEDLMFLQADEDLRFINEVKGMNPIMVFKPSSMKEAAKTVLDAAFRFSGQLINSCSKVVLVEGQQEEFIRCLLDEANSITVTDPTDSKAYTGPIISDRKLKEFEDMLDSIRGNVIFGGKRVRDTITENGPYVVPAIVMGLDDEHDLNNMDSALPILSIQVASGVDDAIDIINCTEYGMSAGIITKDEAVSKRFREEVDAENIFVNDRSKIPGAAYKAAVDLFLD